MPAGTKPNEHGSVRHFNTGERKQGYEAQILNLINERLQ